MRITDTSILSDKQRELIAKSLFTTPQDDSKPLRSEAIPKITIELPIKLISQNKGSKRNWHKLREYKKIYTEHLMPHRLKKPLGIAKKLTITRILGKGDKQWDLPNIPYACKELIDSIVDANLLIDDSPQCLCEVAYKQDFQRRGNGAIKIEIEF